jgi:hypothetical protein
MRSGTADELRDGGGQHIDRARRLQVTASLRPTVRQFRDHLSSADLLGRHFWNVEERRRSLRKFPSLSITRLVVGPSSAGARRAQLCPNDELAACVSIRRRSVLVAANPWLLERQTAWRKVDAYRQSSAAISRRRSS